MYKLNLGKIRRDSIKNITTFLFRKTTKNEPDILITEKFLE